MPADFNTRFLSDAMKNSYQKLPGHNSLRRHERITVLPCQIYDRRQQNSCNSLILQATVYDTTELYACLNFTYRMCLIVTLLVVILTL